MTSRTLLIVPLIALAACSGNDSSKPVPQVVDSTAPSSTSTATAPSTSSGTAEHSVTKGMTTPSASPSGIAGTGMGLGETDEEAPSQGFAGHWYWTGENRLFVLILEQKGARLSGWFGTADGDDNAVDKIDREKPPTVSGTVSGRKATVKFTSSATNVTGRATITIGKTGLDWKITSRSNGELWIPEKGGLKREENM